MTDNYRNYRRYLDKYKTIKAGGDKDTNASRSYQIGVLKQYIKKADTSKLDALEIGVQDINSSLQTAKKFRSYTVVDSKHKFDKEKCDPPIKLSSMSDLVKNTSKKTYDFIVVNDDAVFQEDFNSMIDMLYDLLDDNGVLLIDTPRADTRKKELNDLKRYLIKDAAKKYNIRVAHLEKKTRDLYAITKNFADFYQSRKDVPPADRWF